MPTVWGILTAGIGSLPFCPTSLAVGHMCSGCWIVWTVATWNQVNKKTKKNGGNVLPTGTFPSAGGLTEAACSLINTWILEAAAVCVRVWWGVVAVTERRVLFRVPPTFRCLICSPDHLKGSAATKEIPCGFKIPSADLGAVEELKKLLIFLHCVIQQPPAPGCHRTGREETETGNGFVLKLFSGDRCED